MNVDKVNLSKRIRANSEAAPWVIDEVKAMEEEIEQLRAELAAAKAGNVALEESYDILKADLLTFRNFAKAKLAEAKAASVCPVKFYWCYQSNECDILIHGMNDEDSTRFGNWLDDRMKERDEK